MSNSIYEVDFLRSLPDVFKNDENIVALATAIGNELSVLAKDTNAAIIYAHIDELSEDVLDILAYDFKIDWWDYNYSLDEKRKVLKDSWNVHRTLGTKRAVEKAISAIYPNTKVEEWFEYGGEPFNFKLLIDATYQNVDPVKHQKVLDRVKYYKNLRSFLEAVVYVSESMGAATSFSTVAVAGLYMNITAEVKVYGMG